MRAQRIRNNSKNADIKPPKKVAMETSVSSSKGVKELSSKKQGSPQPWCPTSQTAFKVLLSARLCAAVWSGISDCDETYNYWEPTHFLMYGSGFQTWEYSPAYGLRSYAYLWPQAFLGLLYSKMLQPDKIPVFYFMRCFLGLSCAASESYFYNGVIQAFGPHMARICLAFLLFSSGMFISSTAYLPSAFSMIMTMLAYGAVFRKKYQLAILATAVSSLVGWPFAALTGVPIAVSMIMPISRRRIIFFVKWVVYSLILILIPLVAVDSCYYGRLTIAPLNIILYNVFSKHGPELYGIEPWYFYFQNLFLNFNAVAIAAILSGPLFIIKYLMARKSSEWSKSELIVLSSLYLWIVVFFTRPHKEERFLFPIYPLICFAASHAVDTIQRISFFTFFQKTKSSVSDKNKHLESTNWMAVIIIAVTSLLSLSRSIALYKGYRAPIEVFLELNGYSQESSIHDLTNISNVCVGKEWHRFPSSFFLPKNWELLYLRSEFRGQLPKPYDLRAGSNATSIIPDHMNDQNREEVSRYSHIRNCKFLVDSDFSDESKLEPRYSLQKEWETIISIPFLNPRSSSRLFRSFYVPYFTETRCHFINYNVLKKK